MSALIINDVATTPTAKLLEFFNANTGGNQVAKFRDRATAEKRVLALIAEMAAEESGDQAAAKAACRRGDEVVPADDAPDYSSAAVAARVAEAKVVEAAASAPAPAKPLDRDSTKPWQRAKVIISDCLEVGITQRKAILATCVAAGIKYNTADGAHYEMCVKGKAKS